MLISCTTRSTDRLLNAEEGGEWTLIRGLGVKWIAQEADHPLLRLRLRKLQQPFGALRLSWRQRCVTGAELKVTFLV